MNMLAGSNVRHIGCDKSRYVYETMVIAAQLWVDRDALVCRVVVVLAYSLTRGCESTG
jgi:hypothetical protein